MHNKIITRKVWDRRYQMHYFVAYVHIIEGDQMIWAEKTKAKRLSAEDARIDAMNLIKDIREQNGIIA